MTRFSVSGPSSSVKSDYSNRYDYSGLSEHIKRQDAVSGLRDEKFDALYDGDPKAAVKAGNRIRDLVSALRMNDPSAGERQPVTVANPLAKLEAESGESSVSFDEGGYAWETADGVADAAGGGAAPVAATRRRNGVGGNPNRFANLA